jgi:hypothetical protein
MRVLHFLGIGNVPKKPLVDASGGTERVALEIARIQARRGAEVMVASMAPAVWRGFWEGVSLRHLKPYSWAKVTYRGRTWDFRNHLRLSTLIQLGGFDIVHLHEYRGTRFFVNQPKVMQFHNNPLDGLTGAALAAARLVTGGSSAKAQPRSGSARSLLVACRSLTNMRAETLPPRTSSSIRAASKPTS